MPVSLRRKATCVLVYAGRRFLQLHRGIRRAQMSIISREETPPLEDLLEFPEGHPSKRESQHLVTERQKKFIAGSQFYQLNTSKWQWDADEVLPSKLPGGARGILRIQVLDSGCGMSEEDQAKLFQKFSQVSQAAGQRKVGTGLGLWICKELASRLDGDIKTRSVEGLGSVFELAIQTRVSHSPKKLHELRSPGRASTTWYLPSFEQKAPNTLKILVADDDSFNIELMKNFLNKFGIGYICAYDGEDAVTLFKKHYKEIGFIITDNFMPKKTGAEAALEITSLLKENQLPKVPIVCVSGDLKVTAGESGFTSVFQKPINFDRLKEEIMTIYPQVAQQADIP